ncbi:MAG: HAMP domain-containing histidine kinase [Magnetovibrio sp.]|nr:HAMP domain-containing histidine kinase [Magnetovibrio sp.]
MYTISFRQWSTYSIAAIIFIFILAFFFVMKMENRLKESIEGFSIVHADSLIWGAQQFRNDLNRVRTLLQAYGDPFIEFDPSELQESADILYSQFETLNFTTQRLESIEDQGLTPPIAFEKLSQLFNVLDQHLTIFIQHPNNQGYVSLLSNLDTVSDEASVYSAKILHLKQFQTTSLRAQILSHANNYKLSLIVVFVGTLLLIGVVWHANWRINIFNAHLEQAVLHGEEAAQTKAQFLSSMSHEFRTPLNAISGYIQLILMCLTPEQRKNVTGYEKAIDTSVNNLVDLVDQILELETLLHGNESLILDKVDIRLMISNAVMLSGRQAITHHVNIHTNNNHQSFEIETDSGMFTQVITCLISNGIKFNHDGGDVWVSSKVEGDQVIIRVEDNGIGIPAEKIQKLFQPFERLGHEAGAINGSGTGLSVCQTICTRLGMTLDYVPRKSGGSIFILKAQKNFSQTQEKSNSINKPKTQTNHHIGTQTNHHTQAI